MLLIFVVTKIQVVVLFVTEVGGLLIWTVKAVFCCVAEIVVAVGVTPEELPVLPGVLVAVGLPLLDEEGVEIVGVPPFFFVPLLFAGKEPGAVPVSGVPCVCVADV